LRVAVTRLESSALSLIGHDVAAVDVPVQQVLLEFGAQAGERRGIVAIALFTRILDQVVEFAEALPPTSNLDPIATNKGRDTHVGSSDH
jgi:hypothetical protein